MEFERQLALTDDIDPRLWISKIQHVVFCF